MLCFYSYLISGVRPFGVSVLLCSVDDEGPHLYQIDPSGSSFAWTATALGKNMSNAKTLLEKRWNGGNLDDAIEAALYVMKSGFEGVMDENNIEMGIVKEDRKFRRLSHEEIKDYLSSM